jgi:stearoyl-CoA desaturase (delta-9 desaturase)
MGVIDLVLFGVVPGVLILLVQLAWIPFWAAGVINGVGHYWGYRNWPTPDWSTNIVPWGILIGGEELHNNHHAYPTSAKLSNKWYEIDIGWLYVRVFQALGLAKVKHVAPRPHFSSPKPTADVQTLQSVIANRYDVLARYAKSLKVIYAKELGRLRRFAPEEALLLREIESSLTRNEQTLREAERAKLNEALPKSQVLQTMVSMRRELAALWERSAAPRDQLVRQFQDWCKRAESSGIRALADFSQRLRSYA